MDLLNEGNFVQFTRRELADIVFEDPRKNWDAKSCHLLEFLILKTNATGEQIATVKKTVHFFLVKLKNKYLNVSRTKSVLYSKNEEWFNGKESFQSYTYTQPIGAPKGRPTTSFDSVSDRTKRRKTEHLRDLGTSGSELAFAACRSFRKEGRPDIAKVITLAMSATSQQLQSCLLSLDSQNIDHCRLTGNQALCVFLDADLSVYQYNVIRETNKIKFPPYKQILEAKKLCYPKQDCREVSEKHALVSLQGLADHSLMRIAEYLKQKSCFMLGISNLKLEWKWGIDGTSGFSEYKQKFQDSDTSDASMLVTCAVPLKLSGQKDGKEMVLWVNERPSSPRFCRPVRIQYEHETVEITRKEMDRFENQISNLLPSVVEEKGSLIFVLHELYFTMTDGKLCNAATGTTSTQRCYICKMTSSEFNSMSKMRNATICRENLRFGLSILHAWIRMFECLLHVSYKLTVMKWRVTKPTDKQKIAERKKHVQDEFKKNMGLIVDRPKPGFGNSNDGNTARRFFQNSDLSASITGINKNLINRFHTILVALSSGRQIKTDMFENYCLKTAVVFIKNYPWYYMPTSVHKILMHSSAVISQFLVPIGQLSEEAQEARNKDIKQYREFFSRKCSREVTMHDVFNRLLVTSDPFISSIRKIPKINNKELPKEVIETLNILTTDNDHSAE